MEDDGRSVMAGNQRVELALVLRELAVQIECRLAQCDAHFFHLGGVDLVLLDEIEHRGIHALNRRGGWPQAQRDLLELPAFSEIGGDGLGAPTIGIDVEKPPVPCGQKLARGEKLLLGQQRRHQAREGAAALVKLHRRCPPRCKGPGGLAPREPESLGHGLGVEAAKAANRGGCAERT